MKKILSVDSNLINNKIIEQDIKKYFNSIGEQLEFYIAQNPQETLDIINKVQIDIIFIDISSESFNGLKLLKHIKKQPVRQSKIVAVTTLDDHTYRFEALKLKVYRYIYKPYDNKEIESVLSKFFSINYYNKEINREENFINVTDLVSEQENKELPNEETIINKYLDSHQKLNARDFLELYEDWGYDLDDLEDLEMALDRLTMSILINNDLESVMDDVINILETYNKFLYIFTEFEELSKVVYSIVILLRDIDFEKLECTSIVSKLVITAIQDLVEWKEKVFIAQDVEDVYYINDPILNSYVQIQDLLS